MEERNPLFCAFDMCFSLDFHLMPSIPTLLENDMEDMYTTAHAYYFAALKFQDMGAAMVWDAICEELTDMVNEFHLAEHGGRKNF